MSQLKVEKRDESNLLVWGDADMEYALEDYFSFFVDGYKWMPKFKAKLWDGKARMYSIVRKTLPAGLYGYLELFCKEQGCELVPVGPSPQPVATVTEQTVELFAKELQLHARGKPIETYDYQINAVTTALNDKRRLLLSPTASGKSLIIYLIMRWLLDKHDYTILILVPTTTLVTQLRSDFADYSTANGWNVDAHSQPIFSGFTKTVNTSVVVSTWQSVYKQPASWFNQFDAVIGDEAHLFAAASLSNCMGKMTDVSYRIGTTGTIKDGKVNKLTLEGHFGPVHQVSTTRELMDAGRVSDLKIKVLMLGYSAEDKAFVKDLDYHNELDWVVRNTKRNKMICKLAAAQKGITLVLFQFVEKHGKPLYEMYQTMFPDKQAYLIHGGISTEDRDGIKTLLALEEDAVLFASVQSFATGQNLPKIANIIFASPSKGKIRNLQSIGRGIRLQDGKKFCRLFDLADDLSYKKKPNMTLVHCMERIKIYSAEQFDWEIVNVPITK